MNNLRVGIFLIPILCGAEVRAEEPFELFGLVTDDQALNRPHDVELEGNIAYVPGKGGSLAIIDVADPENPVLLSSMVDPVGLEDAETVLPMGNGILLLGTRDFLSLDVSDPPTPKDLGTDLGPPSHRSHQRDGASWSPCIRCQQIRVRGCFRR